MIGIEKIEPKTEFDKSMLILEGDLEVLGWDQPPRLYALLGEENDWRLELVTSMTGHPVEFMQMMVATGRFSDDVKGVAVATEGWRHIHWDEFKEKHPDTWEKIQAVAETLGLPMDEAEKRARDMFHEACTQIRPSDSPERIEIRNLMVVMRDGRTMGVHRDRGSEAELMPNMGEGRVIDAMKATLTGEWPKGLQSWAREEGGAEMMQSVIEAVRDAARRRQQGGTNDWD